MLQKMKACVRTLGRSTSFHVFFFPFLRWLVLRNVGFSHSVLTSALHPTPSPHPCLPVSQPLPHTYLMGFVPQLKHSLHPPTLQSLPPIRFVFSAYLLLSPHLPILPPTSLHPTNLLLTYPHSTQAAHLNHPLNAPTSPHKQLPS